MLALLINNEVIAECNWNPHPITYSEAEIRCNRLGGWHIPNKSEIESSKYYGCRFQKNTWLYEGWTGNFYYGGLSYSRDNKYQKRSEYYKSLRKAASVCVK